MNDNPHALEWSNFRKNTYAHTLSVLHEDGVYRHLKMAEGDNNFWSWEIVTFPGSLVFRGDIGRVYIFTFDMMHCDNLSSCRVNTYECWNGSDNVRGEHGLCPGCGEVGTRL